MKNITTESTIVFDIREEADNGDIVGSGHGMAVPYGTETMIGGVRESFAPGSFDPADVIGKPLAYRHGEPIGRITNAENREDGLFIDFDIVNTAQGRDAAVLARTNSVKGLSVGFMSAKNVMTKARDAITHTAASLLEVSLTPYPAYATAGVSAIRENEGETMSDTMDSTEAVSVDSEAREAIAQVRESLANIEARAFVSEPVHPLAQFRSFGEYSKAVLAGDIEARALADQITDNNPGVMPPVWLLQVKGIIDLGRPAITSVGGPESAGSFGMDINWPYFDGDLTEIVEAQANEKEEVNSVEIDLEKGDATLATYAAGSDISYQLLQRSSPSYLDAHNRIMAASYSTVTDRKFTNDLWTGSSNTNIYDLSADTTGAKFREEVFLASMEVEDATGAPASVVLASTALFQAIGGWSTFFPAPYGVQNVSGVATASTLEVNVSGLRVIRAKWLDTDADRHAIVLNGEAARWVEDGPRLATAENVSKLGRDVAIYGYGATAVYLPAGVVRLAEN
jgi:HK97 family phage prohead protease